MPLGPWELGIILVIVIIIFGAGKLPEIGGALGKGIREFRDSSRDEQEEGAEEVHSTDSSSDNNEYASADSTRQHDTASTRKNEPAKEEL